MNTKGLTPVLAVLILIIITAFLTSCESRSSKHAKSPLEKVVIIDSQERTAFDNGYKYYIINYKVKRINYGVVDYITITGQAKFATGDTIYTRFY